MEYRTRILKELTTKIGSGATPRGGQESYKDSGISLIRSQNVRDFEFSYDGLAYIDSEQALELSNVKVEVNDILLNITGDSVARVCKVPENILPARVNQHVCIIRTNKDLLLQDYLLYYLLNPQFKKHMLIIASDGATRNALTKTDIEDFEISFPSIQIQRKISIVLSNIDQKINLLHCQNRTLEQIARAIFKHWFIDFEFPNEEGKPYKSSGGKIVFSELGEIPEGWEVGKLSGIFDFLEGPGIRNWQYSESGVKFINIRLINDGDINIKEANCVSFEEGNIKYLHFHLQPLDMVISTSGTLGRSAIVRVSHLPLILNTSVIRFRPVDKYNYAFMYQYLNSRNFMHELLSLASGSVQLNFGPMHLNQIDMIIPEINILNKFQETVGKFYSKVIGNRDQIDHLKILRDALLPKLMNGEVRVRE